MAEFQDYEWVKVRSWHAIATATRAFDSYITVCGRSAKGRTADGTKAESIPGTDKSCERCLKIVTRRNEAAALEQAEHDRATERAGIAAGVGAVPVDADAQPEPITAGSDFHTQITPTTESANKANE